MSTASRNSSLGATLVAFALAASACTGAQTDALTSPVGGATLDLFDESAVHEITVDFDQDEYDAMIDAFTETGEKGYIQATVSIDGVTYERAGMRLKGNSSLAGLGGAGFPGGGARPGGGPPGANDDRSADAAPSTPEAPSTSQQGTDNSQRVGRGGGGPGGGSGRASAEEPEQLPWLIRLDEFVDGQNHQGYEDIVIRSNTTESALNEAVALDLIAEAELASQEAMHTSFAVNGGEADLRLAIEHPSDDAWFGSWFEGDGALYKAESTGGWTYRGDDPDAYEDVFDQEGGDSVAGLAPLTEFLQFINESDDATFAAELSEWLDVEAFATYLATMDLIGNSDDIDGPGNNAYLWYDATTEQMTVVPWDMNLAFEVGGFGGRGSPGEGSPPEDMQIPRDADPESPGFQPPSDRELPEGFEPPEGAELPEGGGPGGFGRSGSNPLVEAFRAVPEFQQMIDGQRAALQASLVDSGTASDVLQSRIDVLSQADDLIDQATLQEEANAIADVFPSS